MKTWRLKDVQIGGLEVLNSADIHRLSGSKAGCYIPSGRNAGKLQNTCVMAPGNIGKLNQAYITTFWRVVVFNNTCFATF